MSANNNYFYGNPAMMGTTFNASAPQPVQFSQPLTKDEAAELMKNDQMFSLKVTTPEIKKAICTHKFPGTNKYSTQLCNDNTGDMICQICGARMNPDDLNHDKVVKIVNDFKNVLQSCKLMYVNIPENVVKQLFTIIPFVDKIPKLYDIAVENHNRFSPTTPNTQDVYGNQSGVLNSFKELINGGMGYQFYGNPNMGMPNYGAAPVQQYPNMNMGYGNPAFMGGNTGNPFYANGAAPVQQYPNMQYGNQVAQPTPVMNPVDQQVQYPSYGTPVQAQNVNVPPAQTAPANNQNTQPSANNGAVERVNATGTLEA